MNYEFWFWIVIAYLFGRASTKPLFYIGHDRAKYEAARIAVLLRDEKEY